MNHTPLQETSFIVKYEVYVRKSNPYRLSTSLVHPSIPAPHFKSLSLQCHSSHPLGYLALADKLKDYVRKSNQFSLSSNKNKLPLPYLIFWVPSQEPIAASSRIPPRTDLELIMCPQLPVTPSGPMKPVARNWHSIQVLSAAPSLCSFALPLMRYSDGYMRGARV